MQIHSFIKEPNGWFIDLPAFIAQGGAKESLQMVEGADTMLDIMAAGRNAVTVAMDTQPFAGADRLELAEVCDPAIGGGYYVLHSFEGKNIEKRMWLCDVTYFVFGDLPDEIFIKRLAE